MIQFNDRRSIGKDVPNMHMGSGYDPKRRTDGGGDYRGDVGGAPAMKKPKGPKPKSPSKARR